MKKLFTLTLENNGQTRKVQAAAASLTEALDRLYKFEKMTSEDHLTDFSTEALPQY